MFPEVSETGEMNCFVKGQLLIFVKTTWPFAEIAKILSAKDFCEPACQNKA